MVLDGPEEHRANSGVYVSARSFEQTVCALPNPVLLDEQGTPWPPVVSCHVTFVLSDNAEFLPEERQILTRLAAQCVSLGPKSLHSSHCITVAHYLMDRGVDL
jgi:tRNA pseudouridine-54 N-methylase